MANNKVIAVTGATGSQGGGLARAILADPSGGFACRAITRDPNKDKARELAAKGAEVVRADIDDVESLKKAFAGAHGAYCVTNFWEHFSAEKEKAQAKNMAEAAKAAGVKHVIWSTLEDTRKLMSPGDTRMPMLQEKYSVPHFDAKAEADAYFAGLPVTYPRDVVLLGQPLHRSAWRRRRATTACTAGRFRWATSKLAGHRRGGHRQGRVRDLQGRAAVRRQDRRHRRREPDARRDEREARRKRSASPVKYNAVEPDAYRGFGFPGRRRDGQHVPGLSRLREGSARGARSADAARSLNPALQNFDQWLAKNKSKIALG